MKKISMTYGQVLFDLEIKEKSIQEAEKQLSENPELFKALENPTITKDEKAAVIDRLFSDDLKSFLKVMCENGDIDCFGEACEYYRELERQNKKIIKAEFDYVTMPGDEQLKRIKQYLIKKYQAKEVDLYLVEDASLIGGFVLKVKDQVYDNSLKGKMKKMQQSLTWR